MNVEIKDLSFAYDRSGLILDKANLSVEASSSAVILGASGSGKSTLLKIIAGVLTESNAFQLEGSMTINDRDMLEDPDKFIPYRTRGKIGYMFQRPILFDHMTVKDNVALPSKLIKRENKQKLEELMELVGLSEHQNKYPRELSGGMQTRAALARLFSTKPKLLLLDEPFGSLDIGRRTVLYEEFHQLNRLFKTTTILVTHDIFEAMVFSNNICLIGLKGSTSAYKIEDWSKYEEYANVVEKHQKYFSELSEKIKNA
jgi:NitT/TauT family transport system ATP-binding protein